MAVLQPSEYDVYYYDGGNQDHKHPAGYSQYVRNRVFKYPGSRVFRWSEVASKYINHLALSGKKLLEIGCAKGFLVKSLRDNGVDAYGIDISTYAIGECEPEVASYVNVGDARDLSAYSRNEFDVVFTRGLFSCLAENEIQGVIDEIGRISKQSVHVLFPDVPEEYYTKHTMAEWGNFNWPPKTTLIDIDDEWNYLNT